MTLCHYYINLHNINSKAQFTSTLNLFLSGPSSRSSVRFRKAATRCIVKHKEQKAQRHWSECTMVFAINPPLLMPSLQ